MDKLWYESMKKHVAIVDSFADEHLAAILRTGREDTRFMVRPNEQHLSANVNSIIYADTPYQRWVAASKWIESEDYTWSSKDLSDFMDENGEHLKYHTPSAFALSLYRSMTPEYTYMAQDGFRARMCRASLYGGRCEVLAFGRFEAHQYDINSSYPYSACSVYFPDPRKIRVVRPTLDNILYKEGVSRISFSQSGYFPVLPIRYNNRVYYVECDNYTSNGLDEETTYTHVELRHALEHGVTINAIHRQYIADESTLKPFDRFMEYCFYKRETTGRKIWKLIANSLIGRLSVKPGVMYSMRPAVSESDIMQYKPERVGFFGVWCVGDEVTPNTDSNPLWASMTLAVARRRLYNITKPTDALYIDTDCVFAEYERKNYDVGTGLGQLKHTSGDFDIKGAKLYTKTDHETNITILKMKGIGRKHRGLDDYERSRYTSERVMLPDGLTRPYTLDNGVLE